MADDKKPDPAAGAANAAGQPAKYAGTPEGQTPKGPEQAPAQATHTATAAEQASDTFGGPAPMGPKRGGARERAAQAQQAPPQLDTATLGAAIVAAQQQITKMTSQQVGTPDIDKTVPGGLYVVDGRTVNAHGEEIKDLRGED